MDKISIETQIKLVNARLDCIVNLLGLENELMKCALAKLGTKEQYDKVIVLYKQHRESIIANCSNTMNNIMEVAVTAENKARHITKMKVANPNWSEKKA